MRILGYWKALVRFQPISWSLDTEMPQLVRLATRLLVADTPFRNPGQGGF